jgi:hypothetical protein
MCLEGSGRRHADLRTQRAGRDVAPQLRVGGIGPPTPYWTPAPIPVTRFDWGPKKCVGPKKEKVTRRLRCNCARSPARSLAITTRHCRPIAPLPRAAEALRKSAGAFFDVLAPLPPIGAIARTRLPADNTQCDLAKAGMAQRKRLRELIPRGRRLSGSLRSAKGQSPS